MREIGNNHVLVPEGLELIDFNKLISLNGSAKYLWEQLQDVEFTAQRAAELLTTRYEVSESQALEDVEQLLGKWKETGLIAD